MTYKPSFWKKLVSWLYPYNIETVVSKISGQLEVNLQYGTIVIDSPKANYSFGNLHTVFSNALSEISFDLDKTYHVLILGFGAGSITDILRNQLKLHCSITGIELDTQIIELSKKYYAKNLFQNTNIVIEDAFQFMQKNKMSYDLICVDLFVDTNVPKKFQEISFLNLINKALNKNGNLLMNTMQDNENLKQNWQETFGSCNFFSIQENEVLHYSKKH